MVDATLCAFDQGGSRGFEIWNFLKLKKSDVKDGLLSVTEILV
jgi:hypothetical protein